LNINGTIINAHSNLWNLIYFENGKYTYPRLLWWKTKRIYMECHRR